MHTFINIKLPQTEQTTRIFQFSCVSFTKILNNLKPKLSNQSFCDNDLFHVRHYVFTFSGGFYSGMQYMCMTYFMLYTVNATKCNHIVTKRHMTIVLRACYRSYGCLNALSLFWIPINFAYGISTWIYFIQKTDLFTICTLYIRWILQTIHIVKISINRLCRQSSKLMIMMTINTILSTGQ